MKYFKINGVTRVRQTKILSNFLNLSIIQLSNMLLLVLMYPIITRIIGIENFGFVMLASSFAGLTGIIINYGTNQSGIKDIAVNKDTPKELSKVFSNILGIRTILFIFFLSFFFILQWFDIRYYEFLFFAIPIVLSEVLNPLFLYLGQQNLSFYNISNLVSKIIIIILILAFIKVPADSKWVNFIIGTVTTFSYAGLILFSILKFKLTLRMPAKKEFIIIAKENFYLTGNNISVHLQQSLMIFVLARWGTAYWLGAYTLCDKIIWSGRLLIVSISSAIYPTAAQLFKEEKEGYQAYLFKTKRHLAVLFLAATILLFSFPDMIITIIAGQANETAAGFLRSMAFLPFLAALNSMNVIDLLIKDKNREIFKIAMILLAISVLTSLTLVLNGQAAFFGIYTVIIELCALIMYEFHMKTKLYYNA